MFDLDTGIREWRLSLGAGMRVEDREELEEHLRSSWTDLAALGLSPEEAFLVARRRLGAQDELEREFGKVHQEAVWIARIQWMVLGFLGIHALVTALSLSTSLCSWVAHVLGLAPSGRLGALAVVQVVALAGLIWAFLRLVRSYLREGRRLLLLGLLLALATPALLMGRGVVQIGLTRILSPSEFGQMVMQQTYVTTIASIGVPLILFVLLLLLERRRRTA